MTRRRRPSCETGQSPSGSAATFDLAHLCGPYPVQAPRGRSTPRCDLGPTCCQSTGRYRLDRRDRADHVNKYAYSGKLGPVEITSPRTRPGSGGLLRTKGRAKVDTPGGRNQDDDSARLSGHLDFENNAPGVRTCFRHLSCINRRRSHSTN
jgi:hypothetical protein